MDECPELELVERIKLKIEQLKASQFCLRLEISHMKQAIEDMEAKRSDVEGETQSIHDELDSVVTMCAQVQSTKERICTVKAQRAQEIAQLKNDLQELSHLVDNSKTHFKKDDEIGELDEEMNGKMQLPQLSSDGVKQLVEKLNCAHDQLCIAEETLLNMCEELQFLQLPALQENEFSAENNEDDAYISPDTSDEENVQPLDEVSPCKSDNIKNLVPKCINELNINSTPSMCEDQLKEEVQPCTSSNANVDAPPSDENGVWSKKQLSKALEFPIDSKISRHDPVAKK